MSETDVDQLLSHFLDKVETLVHRYESLRKEKTEWKNKAEALQETLEAIRKKNDRLESELDQQRLEFSELAGSLENRLNRIKEEASRLLSENNQ